MKCAGPSLSNGGLPSAKNAEGLYQTNLKNTDGLLASHHSHVFPPIQMQEVNSELNRPFFYFLVPKRF